MLLRRVVSKVLDRLTSHLEGDGRAGSADPQECLLTGADESVSVRGLFLLAYQRVSEATPLMAGGNTTDFAVPAGYLAAVSTCNHAQWSFPSPSPSLPRDGRQGPIHVAFLSTFLRAHSVGRLLGPIIAHLASDRGGPRGLSITVIHPCLPGSERCQHQYHAKDMADPLEHMVREAVGAQWHDIGVSDLASFSRAVAALRVDVLVFGDTVMDSKTAYISSLRLAPIQMAFWGHPFSSGSPSIDYFVTSDMFERYSDAARVPRQRHFSEQLVRFSGLSFALPPTLPLSSSSMETVADVETYLSWVQSRAIDLTGAAARLPDMHSTRDDIHVYACLQSSMKLHPAFDIALRDILKADSCAIIILLQNPSQPVWQAQLVRRMSSIIGSSDGYGLRQRVWWLPQMSALDYQRLLCGADVSLDPYPFGGGLTLADALLCEPHPVPFVTLPARQSVHAIGAGIADSFGVASEMVAMNESAYVALALRRASRDDSEKTLWQHVAEAQRHKKMLTDVPRHAKEWRRFLEAVSASM